VSDHKGHPGNEGGPVRRVSQPYWKRAHRDWRFWLGFVAMFAALAMFAMNSNLIFLHRP
jgi:hypothetical protein